jgi:hypothetical protein
MRRAAPNEHHASSEVFSERSASLRAGPSADARP